MNHRYRMDIEQVTRGQRARGFSLIETMMCVAIIGILTVISVNSYQGALDQSDIKYAAPGIVGRLEAMRREAIEKGSTIKIELMLGDSKWKVTRRKGEEVVEKVEDLASEGLIKRKLRFLRYEWPDGGDAPAEFTFFASAAPQGGTVWFGSNKAETQIKLMGGRIFNEYGIRERR